MHKHFSSSSLVTETVVVPVYFTLTLPPTPSLQIVIQVLSVKDDVFFIITIMICDSERLFLTFVSHATEVRDGGTCVEGPEEKETGKKADDKQSKHSSPQITVKRSLVQEGGMEVTWKLS